LRKESIVTDYADQEAEQTTQCGTNRATTHETNILNEPVSTSAYRLQHRKSIHDEYFNTDLTFKNANSSADESKMTGSGSPNKTATMGLVSEAFRKQNKFTHDAMIRVNPQLRSLMVTTPQ